MAARELRDPITFRAALPHGRAALSVDAEGEAHLVLAVPASDVPGLTSEWSRLQDTELLVAIVPSNEPQYRPPRRGGTRRQATTQTEA